MHPELTHPEIGHAGIGRPGAGQAGVGLLFNGALIDLLRDRDPRIRAVAAIRPANTSPSSNEFDARRLAPCTPVHAASPHAQSPGNVAAPSRSVHTPPER